MSLITKYRPKHWDEVIGNNSLINSILSALHIDNSRAFLLYGNTGCGKTTIARLSAKEVDTDEENIIEVDAATDNGVDDMRKLTSLLNYKPLHGTTRSIIIDECQAITAQAWKALLKSIEEPPAGTYWFLCTTEPEKIPINIKNRCTQYRVAQLTKAQLRDLLNRVCIWENKKVSSDILNLCIGAAEGSPRRALAFLAQVIDLDLKEAEDIIKQEVEQHNDVYALADYLSKPGYRWSRLRIILGRLIDQNPESIRRIVEAYLTKLILNTVDIDEINHLMPLLDAFSKPITGNSIAPIILAATSSMEIIE